MSNLIVIMFNLLYPVFYVGFICTDCVCERECEDSWQSAEQRRFCGEAFPRSEAYDQYMTGMRRVKTDGDNWFSRVSRG